MRIFLIDECCTELAALPQELPPRGYLWVAPSRSEFETEVAGLQATLQRWTGGQLVDLHLSDLRNQQLPSRFDYTSWYDLLVFRRLAAVPGSGEGCEGEAHDTESSARAMPALRSIDTSPVGFAVFDRVLLTVHPSDCQAREFFAQRLLQVSTTGRMPASPADLMLRIVNHLVDGYLELRRLLTRQLGNLQQDLMGPRRRRVDWHALLESRNLLHQLEDVCEDQQSAMQEWLDALGEWPAESDPRARHERELLRLRSRDVQEHIERVLAHVRRLQSSAESAVQMHFLTLGQRTNDIMRTLTVLTAIFLPLNLITGFFGMNFDSLPLIHTATGVWVAMGVMTLLGVGLSLFFWRKRYLGTRHA